VGRTRRGRSLLLVMVMVVMVAVGCTVPESSGPDAVDERGADETAAADGADDDPSIEETVLVRTDLAPIEDEQVRIIDEDHDLAFTMPDADVDRSVTGEGVREYGFSGWSSTGDARDDGPDDAVDVRLHPGSDVDAVLAEETRRTAARREAFEVDGVTGVHVVYSAEDISYATEVWAVPIPIGGVIVVNEDLVEETETSVGPIVAESIRFGVGYGGGPTMVRATPTEGGPGDGRAVPQTDRWTGISWRMAERTGSDWTTGTRGPGNSLDPQISYYSAHPDDRDGWAELVSIVTVAQAPTIEDALRFDTKGENIEVVDTAVDITVDGRPGRGGTATFEGSRREEPVIQRVWAVPIDGGYLVLQTAVWARLDVEPPALDDLAATVTIPEGAAVPPELNP